MKITNVKVYGIGDSIRRSKYPMAVYTEECTREITKTTVNLGKSKIGCGEDNFLNGIVVQFDLTCSLKMWTQVQRYHFLDFVSLTMGV